MNSLKNKLYTLLRWSERYTKTDMVYLATSGFWINLGSISVTGFSFLLYLAFAHFLPIEVYGTYQYLLSVSAVVGALTLTGMNGAVSRAVARGYEGSLRACVRMQIQWGVIPLIGAWIAGAYYIVQGNTVLGAGLLLIGIFVPLNNALNTYGALSNGRKDFKRGFFFNTFNNVLYYPAIIIAAYFSNSALILLAANLISQVVALSILYWLVLRIYKPNDRVDPETMKYGTQLSAIGLIGTVAGQLDSILAFHFLGAAPLALYSFATGLPDRIASMTKFLQFAAFPKMATQDAAQIKKSIVPKVLWALVGSSILAGMYMLASPFIFGFFFPAYVEAIPYSVVYALIIVPWASGIFATALTANQSVRALYVFNTVTSILQIVLLCVGVIFWGLWGLIAARLLLAAFQFLFSALLFFTQK